VCVVATEHHPVSDVEKTMVLSVMMYTETAYLMQASPISGGFTEIQNKNLS